VEAEADVLELEEHEEGMLEPRDTVGVPLAVAAPAAGSISLMSSMGSSAAGWLAGGGGFRGLGSVLYGGPTRGSKFEAACRRNGFCGATVDSARFLIFLVCGVSGTADLIRVRNWMNPCVGLNGSNGDADSSERR
jgi:hypothetical protein